MTHIGTPDLGPRLDIARHLAARLTDASPLEIISAARMAFAEDLAIVSSFGAESAVLLHMASQVDRTIPVLFLDTGHMFADTLAYRDTLTTLLGLTNVRTVQPDPRARDARDPDNGLWAQDTDACCALRKVEPLERALTPYCAWISGRKRYQAITRTALQVVEVEDGRVKINPLADIGPAEIEGWMRAHKLPPHPLQAIGFASIGCMPCTSRVRPGEDPRAGRWRGSAKTECGIHAPHAHRPAD